MRASPNGLTVLVVEDDWLVRADIVLGLEQEGWFVLEASTGEGALKLLQETTRSISSSPILALPMP